MNKNIFFLLIASPLGLHASMHQSALTKKTTKTVREYIAQHQTAIGVVAVASLAAYHYREPISAFFKNLLAATDPETKTAQNDQDSSNGLDRAINPDDAVQRALSTATSQILSIQAALDEHKSASSSSSQLLVVPPIQLPHHTGVDDEKHATKREKLEMDRLHSYPAPEVSSLAAGASAQVDPEIEEVKAILDGIILTAGNLLRESELSLRDESDDNAQTTMNTLEAVADILSQPRLTAAQLVQDQEALLHTPTTALNTDTRGILLLTAAATSNSAEPASGYHTPQESII